MICVPDSWCQTKKLREANFKLVCCVMLKCFPEIMMSRHSASSVYLEEAKSRKVNIILERQRERERERERGEER